MPVSESCLPAAAADYVRRWETTAIATLVSDLFGYRALQLGWPETDLLASNRMALRLRCDAEAASAGTRAHAFALPFASASIDLVVLAHVLDGSPWPQQVLREVERVLVAEGSLVVSGFNPWSSWGLRRAFGGGRGAGERYRSTLRVRDWLTLLGFEIQSVQRGCSIPPFARSACFRHLRWLDAGPQWLHPGAGVWLMHGIKRVHGMRLLTPRWREQAAARPVLGVLSPRGSQDGSWSGQQEHDGNT